MLIFLNWMQMFLDCLSWTPNDTNCFVFRYSVEKYGHLPKSTAFLTTSEEEVVPTPFQNKPSSVSWFWFPFRRQWYFLFSSIFELFISTGFFHWPPKILWWSPYKNKKKAKTPYKDKKKAKTFLELSIFLKLLLEEGNFFLLFGCCDVSLFHSLPNLQWSCFCFTFSLNVYFVGRPITSM